MDNLGKEKAAGIHQNPGIQSPQEKIQEKTKADIKTKI